eukprot:4678093-Pyramimonas_sp.AAC.1
MGKRGRRSRSPPYRQFSWERDDDRFAGGLHGGASSEDSADLEDHLLQLYATGRIDAKALCLTCFFAVKAGARGTLLEKLQFGPGKQSGKYAKHLRDALPEQVSAPELHFLDLPVYLNGART